MEPMGLQRAPVAQVDREQLPSKQWAGGSSPFGRIYVVPLA